HLEAMPRREDYRRAREQMLGSCGQQTLAVDRPEVDEPQALRTHRGDEPQPPIGAKYWLVDQDGVHNLKVGLNTIGRMPDNDVSVPDGSVSRRHCAIVVHATRGCELFDTASKNGTFVNGQRIAGPTTLKAGDQIRLCDRQFVFLSGDRADPPHDDPNGRTHVDD
ncbi:MAG TPA: FHA domain-containing protein, partial [Gemmataceae bacterium]